MPGALPPCALLTSLTCWLGTEKFILQISTRRPAILTEGFRDFAHSLRAIAGMAP
jgi:hypothetical protein